jgi:hypothetical protein
VKELDKLVLELRRPAVSHFLIRGRCLARDLRFFFIFRGLIFAA